MNITFTGRAALIAAGLWLGVAAHVTPVRAQDAEPAATAEPAEAPAGKPIALKKFTKQTAAKKKVAASTRADKVKAAKASASDTSDEAKPAAAADDASAAPVPASIADANAQLPGGWPETAAQAVPAPSNPLQADALIKSVGVESHPKTVGAEPGAQVVSPDELNDIDRTAGDNRPELTLASATLDPPAAAATPADNTTWDKTSLIGKVFIAFGGLLTMASAARMFMA